MNTTRTLTHLTMIVATAAAAFVAQASNGVAAPVAAPKLQVIQLERVVITGKRLAAEPVNVVQLPRVVITGKRLPEAADTLVAQKSPRAQGAKVAG